MRPFGRGSVGGKRRFGVGRPLLERPGKRLGIELHAVGTDVFGQHHCLVRGVDEEADADACRLHRRDHRRQAVGVGTTRPPRLARNLAGNDRHEGALLGPHRMHHLDEVGTRVPLHVEFDRRSNGSQPLRDLAHIGQRDVPLVRAWVHGNPRHSSRETDLDGIEHTWLGSAARVAQRRHFVDVDGESDHGNADCEMLIADC